MKFRLFIFFSLATLWFSSASAQANTKYSSLTDTAVKFVLQGVWAGPDESYYFLFRGDSVKEWEADGADSSNKPWCSYIVSKTACDSLSAHVQGTSGYFMTITCHSTDYDEVKCYFIQSINADSLQLGIKGQIDPSGLFTKMKKKNNE